MDNNQKQSLGGVKNTDISGATPNNNIDGFAAVKPNANSNNSQTVGSVVNSSSPQGTSSQRASGPLYSSNQDSNPMQSPAQPQPMSVSDEKSLANTPEADAIRLKATNKALKIWLIVFIVVFVAALAGLIVYFMQHSQSQSKLNDANAKNAQLQQAADQKALANDQQQNSSLQTQLTQTQAQLVAAQAQVKTLTAQNTTANANIATLQTYITTLTATATQLKTTCGTACASITIPAAPTLAKQ